MRESLIRVRLRLLVGLCLAAAVPGCRGDQPQGLRQRPVVLDYVIEPLVGTPREFGDTDPPRDGPLAQATFSRRGPYGMSLAPDGSIYVADGMGGLRVIREGYVETVPLPEMVVSVEDVAVGDRGIYMTAAVPAETIDPPGRTSEVLLLYTHGGDLINLTNYECRHGRNRCFRPRPVTITLLGGKELLLGTLYGGQVYHYSEDGTEFLIAGRLPFEGGIGFNLNDGAAAQGAWLGSVGHVAVGRGREIYISDAGCRIRRVDTLTGLIDTVAGGAGLGTDRDEETCGSSGDGGLATEAILGHIPGQYIAVGNAGELIIGETHRIRVVDEDGIIHTVAGFAPVEGPDEFGTDCRMDDGGPATEAFMFLPRPGFVDADGVIYVGESQCNRIRVLRPAERGRQ